MMMEVKKMPMFHNDRWIPLCQEKQAAHFVVVAGVGASENELDELIVLLLFNILTAVSVRFGPSSDCAVGAVESSLVVSASIKGFFCLRRTSKGDCFSG